ncbi:MobA/MobL family protein [Psychrobacter sp. DAB_AL32B]|uniref:MobA/MobL family protein n=1 Tax=Psychrobacter sp. DAB_AL32B TaxID=1028414 RepID=UPI000F4EA4C0
MGKHRKYAVDKLGIDERIDHRTLKQQGIEQKPTIKIGLESVSNGAQVYGDR